MLKTKKLFYEDSTQCPRNVTRQQHNLNDIITHCWTRERTRLFSKMPRSLLEQQQHNLNDIISRRPEWWTSKPKSIAQHNIKICLYRKYNLIDIIPTPSEPRRYLQSQVFTTKKVSHQNVTDHKTNNMIKLIRQTFS